MAQRLLDHSWIVLLIVAISLVVACGSSTSGGGEDSGSIADAMTQG